MKQTFSRVSRFLIPGGLTAALLALFLLFFTCQPSTGRGTLYATVGSVHQVQEQAISRQFQADSLAIEHMDPRNTQAVERARRAATDRYQATANANNLQWQAQVQQLNHSSLMVSGVMTAAALLLFLSLLAFATKFSLFYRARMQSA